MPQQAAFGDIFLVNTPSLDRTAALLYQEQKQRQARAQQENAALDANMQKEFAKVRAADIPDVIDGWSKYKSIKKQLLFDKDLQQDPKKYAAAQQKANEALAGVHGLISGSQEEKEKQKGLIGAHNTHPDNFDDNFGTLMSAAQITPLKKLREYNINGKPIDLTDMNSYMYQGPDQDFSKIFTSAAGQPKQVYAAEEPVDKVGLQTKMTPYLFGSTPKQYSETVLGSLGTHKASKAASFLWNHVPKEERDKVNQEFAEIPADKWKKAGIDVPQDLPTNTGNDAVDFSNFQAKKYFIANEPKQGTPIFRTNEAKKFELEGNRMKQMEAIRHANARDLIEFRKQIDPNDTQLNDLWVGKMIDHYDDLASSTPTMRSVRGGKSIYEHDIPLDPVLSKSLQMSGISPIGVRKMSDGKYYIAYPQIDDKGQPVKDKNTNTWALDNSLSGPITKEQLALAMGAKNVTGKARSKEIGSVLGKTPTKPVSKPKSDPLGLF